MRDRPLTYRIGNRVWWRRADGERGVVLIFTAFALLMILAATAFAVDIGHEESQKRYIEKVADLGALDAVPGLYHYAANGQAKSPADTYQTVVPMVQYSATRNTFIGSSESPTTDYCGAPDASGHRGAQISSSAGRINVYLLQNTSSGRVVLDCKNNDSTVIADTVGVQVLSNVHFQFLPGDQPIQSNAYAVPAAETGLKVGALLARATIDANEAAMTNSILSAELGSSVSLDAVSYQGLVNSAVTLGQLASAHGIVGDPSQLLNVSLTVRQLYTDISTALTAQGTPASLTAAGLMTTLATAATSTQTIRLGQLIKLNVGLSAGTFTSGQLANNANLPVFDLVGFAPQIAIAKGTNLVQLTLPATLSVPGVVAGSITAAYSFLQTPQMNFGPVGTSAPTAQIRLSLNMSLGPIAGMPGSNITLPLYIEGAGATGTITSIQCGGTNPAQGPVSIHVHTNAAVVSIGGASPSSLPNLGSPVPLTTLADLLNYNGGVSGTVTVSSSVTTNGPPLYSQLLPGDTDLPPFTGAFSSNGLRGPQTVGPSNLGIGTYLNTNLSPQVAGTDVAQYTTALNGVTSALNTTLPNIDVNLIEQMDQVLGLRLAGADVWNHAPVVCDAAQLIKVP